jgi:hypothetical protein
MNCFLLQIKQTLVDVHKGGGGEETLNTPEEEMKLCEVKGYNCD